MIRSILKFSISNIFNLLFGILSAYVLTRLFAPDTYGILNVFNTTVATGVSLFYLGLDNSFIRFYNDPPNKENSKTLGTKLLAICLIFILFWGVLTGIFFSSDLTIFIFGIDNGYICFLVFVSISAQLILRFLNIKYRMEFDVKAYTIQSISMQIILKTFVLIAAFLALDIYGVLSFNAFGVLGLAILYIFIQGKSFFSFKSFLSYKEYGTIFLYALFNAPIAICINLNNFFTQQIISHIKGMDYVGIYSSAGYFSSILGALAGGFSTFWSAYMYANYQKKKDEIKKVNEYLLLFIIIVFSFMIFGRDLIYLLIGDQFHESKEFYSMTLCYPMLLLASETTCYGIEIEKKTYFSFLCFAASIMLNLFLSYEFIGLWGLKGVALASAISGLCLYISRTVIAQYFYVSISSIKITIIDIIIIILLGLIPCIITNNFVSHGCLTIILLFVMIIHKDQITSAMKSINTFFVNKKNKN